MNWSAGDVALMPLGVATVMSAVLGPRVVLVEVVVIWVAELIVYELDAVAPKFTDVALVKFVPVITTGVPPMTGPVLGLTAVTVGAP